MPSNFLIVSIVKKLMPNSDNRLFHQVPYSNSSSSFGELCDNSLYKYVKWERRDLNARPLRPKRRIIPS